MALRPSFDSSLYSSEEVSDLLESPTPLSSSLENSYSSEISPPNSKKRGYSVSNSGSQSAGLRPSAEAQCNVCGYAFGSKAKTKDCSSCGQLACEMHCLNKWQDEDICDCCHKDLLFTEMLRLNAIEDPAPLLVQLDKITGVSARLHKDYQRIEEKIAELNCTAAAHKGTLEIQSLKTCLEEEKQRNESIEVMKSELIEAVQNSKQVERLTAAVTYERQLHLETSKNELSIYQGQVQQLTDKLNAASQDFQGLISCRQILASSCRSCKTKVKQRFRLTILEGNFSEAFSTFTRITRSELNRINMTEQKQGTCKCLLM
jgi:hypothetical protein